MRTPTRLATSTLLGLLMFQAGSAQARVPEPDHIFFGTARRNGTPIVAGVVTVVTGASNAPVATFTLNGLTSGFVLRVPIDSLAPQDPGTARPGDTARIYVDGKLAATTTVGDRGTATLVDLDEGGATITTLVSASNPAPFGVGITLTASVSSAAAGGGTPTGNVTFKEGTTILATVPVDANGKARHTNSSLALGAHAVFAQYVGAGVFGPSRSDTLQQVVLSQTATLLTSSESNLRTGQPLTLNALVRALSAGVGTPAGMVAFRDGGTLLGEAPLSGLGTATLDILSLSKGTHLITADYTGSPTFFASRGGPLSQPVSDVEVCSAVSLAAAPSVSAGTDPRSLVTADLNGDGHLDLVVANSVSNDITILLGNGAGGFAAAGAATPAGLAPQAVVTGDFNQDGHADIAVAARDSNQVRILLGNGAGGLAPGAVLTTPTPRALVAVDFNIDGHIDLAVASQSMNTVTLLLGDGSGNLAAQTPVAVGTLPIALASGDVNADGRPDLAVANATSVDVTVLLGDGLGGLAAVATIPVATFPHAIAIGDLNGDGNLDLVTVQSGSWDVHVLLGNGAGSFTEAPTSPFTAGSQPRAVAIADFDLNGTLDLAVTNGASGDLSILSGDGAGGFSLAATKALGVTPYAVVVGDFNADGRADLASANSGSNNVSIQLSDCTAGTQIVVSTSVTPSAFGQTVTFTAVVAAAAPAAGQPTGSVSFLDSGVSIGSGVINGTGQASLTTDLLVPGSHSIEAVYAGDPAFGGGASLPITHVVQAVSTLTTLAVSPLSTSLGEAVTLTAAVQSLQPGLPSPTGNVVFKDGVNIIGMVSLTGSAAVLTTTSLTAGNHTLAGEYVGDVNHNPSSGSLPFTVGAGEPNVTAGQARSISIGSVARTRAGGTTPPVWYRVRLFANRSYQISAWPAEHEEGVAVAPLALALFSDDAGTVPAAGVSGGSGVLEATPNQGGDDKPVTVTIQPSVTGVYKIRVQAQPGLEAVHDAHLLVRETTMFTPWTSRAAGFEGVIGLHNNTHAPVSVTLRAFNSAGALQGAGLTLILPPNATDYRFAGEVGVPTGTFAGLVLTHNGAVGAVSGTIITLNPASGVSFDAPFVSRDPTVGGPTVR